MLAMLFFLLCNLTTLQNCLQVSKPAICICNFIALTDLMTRAYHSEVEVLVRNLDMYVPTGR